MDVVFCFDQRYEQHFGVAVTSLLLNNPSSISQVHIIVDQASHSLRSKLDVLRNSYPTEFCIYEIEDTKLSELKLSAHISTAAYFRLLVTEVLPETLDKVLYLDSDLVVDRSLDELFNLDIQGYALAAWSQIVVTTKKRLSLNSDRYFNSGVLLINLEVWRREQIAQKAYQFAKENPELLDCHDQDALNKIIDGNFLPLSEKWNSIIDMYAEQSTISSDSAIIHYIGSLKPWQAWCLHPQKAVYWKYLKRSPWSKAFPIFPTTIKQFLSAGKYILSYVRKGKLKFVH